MHLSPSVGTRAVRTSPLALRARSVLRPPSGGRSKRRAPTPSPSGRGKSILQNGFQWISLCALCRFVLRTSCTGPACVHKVHTGTSCTKYRTGSPLGRHIGGKSILQNGFQWISLCAQSAGFVPGLGVKPPARASPNPGPAQAQPRLRTIARSAGGHSPQKQGLVF